MKRLSAVTLTAIALFMLLAGAGNCSRARVESMNKMNEGVQAAQQKRYIEAVDALERAAAIDPTNDQSMYNMALVNIEMGQFERAKESLERAIGVNPTNGSYHEKLGTVLMELESWEAAKAALEKALEVDPNMARAHYKLGQVAERLDDQQSALQHYTDAISKGPRFLEAYSALGRLYADLGFLDESVQVLQGALQVAQEGSTEEGNVHHLLGTVFQQQRKFDEAVVEFREALNIEPGNRDALFSLGWTYALQQEREEARRYLKKYVDIAGDEAPRHYVKAAQDKLMELGGP